MKPDTTSAVIKYVTNGWCDSMEQLEANYNPYVVRLVKRFLYEYREINEPEILN